MTVLYAEGFTGIARGSRNFVEGNTDPLFKLGWYLQGRYTGSNALSPDGNVRTQINADPIFAARNVYTMAKTGNSTVDFFTQARKLVDTRGYDKFVFGGMVQTDTVGTDQSIRVTLGGPTIWASSNSAFPWGDTFAQLIIPNNGAQGQVQNVINGSMALSPSTELVKGKPIHFEFLIEVDVKRLRLYLNGILSLDTSLPANYVFAQQNGGISLISHNYPATTASPFSTTWSNIYLLGLDAVHTGILGPATRIMEIAPSGDMDVHWSRPDGFATNAEVLSQTFDNTAPAYLAARDVGDYDVYNAPSAVAANAAKIFGVGMKMNAMTMATGTHTVKPVVKTASGVQETGKEATLTLAVPTPIFADLSVNPDTNALWTPAAISAAGIGFKLKS